MLTAFTTSLILITISELGDKTFFIAVVLSMQHSKKLVFAGVTLALMAMTILSVLFGQVLSSITQDSQIYVRYGEIVLFIAFGLKLLYDAGKMKPTENQEVMEEAREEVKKSQVTNHSTSPWAVLLKSFVLTFIAEWGDRTQIATIALAAGNNAIGVTGGAILGHAICALIAVIGGGVIAGRISEKQITLIGGILFIIFGIIAAIELKTGG
ncbi:TMEM165/GDT1 family protein [Cylindrospermopsis raciborskii]|uniref:GDT1 family protein n=1 Tax=Cylindrospermopsis raciborskii CS-506_A TaxID=2585140 RepID=A0A838WJU0_9CYAN|nr:TMEM165/GDT1 family protein [Cylindrospermopsis raciborskii]MBA4444687.1 TMEM165/GDT1 family protein [Cylindrospermopsis raciborskii CS-506_C]MBA4448906.1 TMEM165/GDT1 family protein [Cylindrospermopsis raciborskii CS-506_D]MBA4455538.1 TMEM165/GDT1 family protein [Cylindrospermopsis raciborskii CS-506_B]MBA4464887.1 TMEM165/GDT1 family protein [Cylindrospermopsis raciborskii CS-506_A]